MDTTIDYYPKNNIIAFMTLTVTLGLMAAYTNGAYIAGTVRNMTYSFHVVGTMLLSLAAINLIISTSVISLVLVCSVEDLKKDPLTGNVDGVTSVLETLGPVVLVFWPFVTGMTLMARGVLLLQKALNFRQTTRARVEIACLGALYAITMGILFPILSARCYLKEGRGMVYTCLHTLMVTTLVTVARRHNIFESVDQPGSQPSDLPPSEPAVISQPQREPSVTQPSLQEHTVIPLSFTIPTVIPPLPIQSTVATSTQSSSITLPESHASTTSLVALTPAGAAESKLSSSPQVEEDGNEDGDDEISRSAQDNTIHQERSLAQDVKLLFINSVDFCLLTLPLAIGWLVVIEPHCLQPSWAEFVPFHRTDVYDGVCSPANALFPVVLFWVYLLAPIVMPLSWMRVNREIVPDRTHVGHLTTE